MESKCALGRKRKHASPSQSRERGRELRSRSLSCVTVVLIPMHTLAHVKNIRKSQGHRAEPSRMHGASYGSRIELEGSCSMSIAFRELEFRADVMSSEGAAKMLVWVGVAINV